MSQFGLLALVAESPGVALAGLDLFNPDLLDPMRAALAGLGRTPPLAVGRVRERLRGDLPIAQPKTLEAALGLSGELANRIRHDLAHKSLSSDTIADIARAKLLQVFEQLDEQTRTLDPPPEPSHNRAEYTLAVLAAAFAARRAESLSKTVYHVPGGLQMPPLVILLSTLLVIQLEDNPNPGEQLVW